jgi:hypothetical protein
MRIPDRGIVAQACWRLHRVPWVSPPGVTLHRRRRGDVRVHDTIGDSTGALIGPGPPALGTGMEEVGSYASSTTGTLVPTSSSSAAAVDATFIPAHYPQSPGAQPPWALYETDRAPSPTGARGASPAARRRSPERKFFRIQAQDIRPGGVAESTTVGALTVTAQGRESRLPASRKQGVAATLLRPSSPSVSQRYGVNVPNEEAVIWADVERATTMDRPQPEPEPEPETRFDSTGGMGAMWLTRHSLEDSVVSRTRRVVDSLREPHSEAASSRPSYQTSTARHYSARARTPDRSIISPRGRAASPDQSIYSPRAVTAGEERRVASPKASSTGCVSSSSEEDVPATFCSRRNGRRHSARISAGVEGLFSPIRDINRHTEQWRRAVVLAERAENS